MVRISATSRHGMPARSTSALKPSFSARPRITAMKVASSRCSSASRSKATPSARSSSMSWNHTQACAGPAGAIRYVCSSTTRKPMFSRTGTRSDSGIGLSWFHTFRPARAPSPAAGR